MAEMAEMLYPTSKFETLTTPSWGGEDNIRRKENNHDIWQNILKGPRSVTYIFWSMKSKMFL